MNHDQLALFGGPRAVSAPTEEIFRWPEITRDDEAAVLDVLRRGAMSGTEVTQKFEAEAAAWHGVQYALGVNNGTAAIQAALFGVGVGVGDEVICPSLTYWASALPAFSLGATVVFADVEADSLCLDPDDIEHRITDRTKAIVVVHYLSHPAAMARIMEIARRHHIAVVEDVSHSQGGRYRGRMLGTIGDVGAMSLMSGKPLAAGEAGLLVTDKRRVYERAIAFGHYDRYDERVEDPGLAPYRGLPLGGCKYRLNQLSAALARTQLGQYPRRSAEINDAMNAFWDRLRGVPGVRAHRPDNAVGDVNGGWYDPHGFLVSDELGGLSVTRFCEALRAEGVPTRPGSYRPLHLHPLFDLADVYGHGRPTRVAHSLRDVRQGRGSLPVTEAAGARMYAVPWFKRHRTDLIEQYACAFEKVSARCADLLAGDPGDPPDLGHWHASQRGVPDDVATAGATGRRTVRRSV